MEEHHEAFGSEAHSVIVVMWWSDESRYIHAKNECYVYFKAVAVGRYQRTGRAAIMRTSKQVT